MTYQALRLRIRTGDLIIVNNDGIMSRVNERLQRYFYRNDAEALAWDWVTHVGVAQWHGANLYIVEQGVYNGKRRLSQLVNNGTSKVGIIRPEGVPNNIDFYINQWQYKQYKYDWLDLYRVFFRLLLGVRYKPTPDKLICTEFVFNIYRDAGMCVNGLHQVPSPAELAAHFANHGKFLFLLE